MCKHLFSGKGGGFLKGLLGIGASLLVPGLGEVLGGALGIGSATAADALAGGLLGGGLSAVEGGNPLMGALTGGIGGAVQGSGILDNIGSSVKSALGIGGDTATSALQPGQTSQFSDISQNAFGGLENAPPVSASITASPTSSLGADSLGDQSIEDALSSSGGSSGSYSYSDVGKSFAMPSAKEAGALEAGGGFNFSSGLSSTPSSSASSGSFLSKNLGLSDLEAGGGIQASTGVAPVSSNFLDSLSTKDVLKYGAPVADLAYQAIQGPAKLPAASQALQAGAGALEATGQGQLKAAGLGALTPGQEAQLAQIKNAQVNALYQQFASQGVTNPQGDSRFIAALQNVDQQIEAQRSQMLGQEFQQGESAITAGGQELDAIAQQELRQQEDYNSQIEEATKALFGLFAS